MSSANLSYPDLIINVDFENKINLNNNTDTQLNYEIITPNILYKCENSKIELHTNNENLLDYNNMVNIDKPSIYNDPVTLNDFKYFYLFIITQIDRLNFILYLSIFLYVHESKAYDIEDYIRVYKKLYEYLNTVKNILDNKPFNKNIEILKEQNEIIILMSVFEATFKTGIK